MNEVLIVPAIVAEAEMLQQIARQTFLESFAESNTEQNMKQYIQESFAIPKLAAELNNPDSEFYFAMLKNQPIGYMKVNLRGAQTELYNSRAVELERIYVLKSHQGQKIGQLLFSKALDIAREAKAPFLWLGVWEHNTNAIGFYKRQGFTEFDSHQFKLGDDIQTDIIMRLDLPA
jgi:ribosomal protein S18 acetylase RimI-like enzyme